MHQILSHSYSWVKNTTMQVIKEWIKLKFLLGGLFFENILIFPCLSVMLRFQNFPVSKRIRAISQTELGRQSFRSGGHLWQSKLYRPNRGHPTRPKRTHPTGRDVAHPRSKSDSKGEQHEHRARPGLPFPLSPPPLAPNPNIHLSTRPSPLTRSRPFPPSAACVSGECPLLTPALALPVLLCFFVAIAIRFTLFVLVAVAGKSALSVDHLFGCYL
jgi:hypothetical protein